MKKLSVNLPCVAAAAAMIFVLGAPSAARAQQPTVAAHVPFSFVVGNQVLPPGNYVVKSDPNDDAVLAIVSTDGKQFVDTLTIPSASDSSLSGSQLVFRTIGDQHLLARVAPADGNARDILLTPAVIERDVAAADLLSR